MRKFTLGLVMLLIGGMGLSALWDSNTHKKHQIEKYQEELAEERYESIPPDRRNGSFCPKCKSTDVGRYVYGYYNYNTDSATAQAVRSRIIIPGGCVFADTYPKFKCNRCNYKWGNFK